MNSMTPGNREAERHVAARPPRHGLPSFTAQVFDASDLWVVAGANHGDGVDQPELAEPGDIYQLDREAERLTLVLSAPGGGAQTLDSGSAVGRTGDSITPMASLTLMTPNGDQVEVLVIRHDDSDARFALPLSPIGPRIDYTLISVAPPPADVRLADVICASFLRGTRIAMANGEQRPIERLRPGDRILTRDNGPQKVRWIGQARLRALGGFAPVVIGEGVLGNGADLAISPHHRIFVYQRGNQRLGDRAELLIQSKHLVDGQSIWRREGGFADYFSLVFDRHEIVYAEGVPCESLLVSEATLGVMPRELSEEMRSRFPGLQHNAHFAPELTPELLEEVGREALLAPRRWRQR